MTRLYPTALRILALAAAALLATASAPRLRAGAALEAPQAVAANPAPVETVVDRGRYLAQAANCISCHTAAGGRPFAGGRAFETPYRFIGRLHSSNITPDRDTGLGLWTEADFIRAMRTGIARDGRHLFPAFPYTSFTKLSSADLKALYAFLRTVPAVRATPPANSFWFRQRWAMVLWNALFFDAGEFVAVAGQSPEWNRGNYLVEALGHCGACHTPRNWLLAERSNARLSGGISIDEVAPGKARIWSASNLTAAKSGLERWTEVELRQYLKTGNNRWAGPLGPMNEVIANSLQYLTPADIAAMATYIKSVVATGESPEQSLTEAERAAGQALYDKHCEECHLSSGRGGFRKAPPVAGSTLVQARNAASLVNVILHGARPAAEIPATFNAWEDMAGFGAKLGDTEVSQLANFLRSNWNNRGGRVTPGFVADQR
jgi:mono/diheme cytochrome c family protein